MIGTCDACGFEGIEVGEVPRSAFDPRVHTPDMATAKICDLCGETPAMNLEMLYNANHSAYEGENVIRTVCYVGNAILKAIAEAKR
jgi:hypothetical protein